MLSPASFLLPSSFLSFISFLPSLFSSLFLCSQRLGRDVVRSQRDLERKRILVYLEPISWLQVLFYFCLFLRDGFLNSISGTLATIIDIIYA